jgi:hypothetical protein
MPSSHAWPLAQVVAELCDRAGVPFDAIDPSGLTGYVEGFAVGNVEAAAALAALGEAYLFDPASHGGMLHFVPRGSGRRAVLAEADLVDDGDAPAVTVSRADALDVPRVMTLEYYAVDGGLTPATQRSDRRLDDRVTGESGADTAVIMTDQQAAELVAVAHRVAIVEASGERKFSLADNWLALTVGDRVTLDGTALRITEIEIDDGQQTYTAVPDRASAYTATVTAVPSPLPDDPADLVLADTRVELLDCHILRDADDQLGVYLAGAPASAGAWQGAVVEVSWDGGANYVDQLTASAWSVTGTLQTELPAHPVEYPDQTNTARVVLDVADNALTPSTLAGMLNRENLASIGDELVNFADVTEASPGVWDVSHWLRGRKGSPVAAHPAGTRFVLLRRASLYWLPVDLMRLGQTVTLRATTVGGEVSTVAAFPLVGRSQTERAPAYLQVQRTGGNLVISWQGVGRLGGGASVAMGAYFAGYVVTINGVAQPVTQLQALTIADPGGSVTVGVQQLNTLTGLGPATEVTV